MTRLDDLLDAGQEAKKARERTGARRAVLRVLGVFILSILVHSFLRVLDAGTSLVLVFVTVGAIFALNHVIRLLDIQRLPSTLRENPVVQASTVAEDDGMNAAARKWTLRLDYAQDEPRNFARMIQPDLIDIIDERIRLSRGITRAADPDQFREIVGPELWKFITGPAPKRMTPKVIATLVARMEAL